MARLTPLSVTRKVIKELPIQSDTSDLATGRIIKRIGDRFMVHHDQQEVVCAVRKTVAKSELSPVVGDWVRFSRIDDGSGVIEQVLERRTSLTRTAAGPKPVPQVLLANLDLLVVVSSLAEPDPNPRLIDRFLVMAEFADIPSMIIWNKIDLLGLTPPYSPPTIRQRRTSSMGEGTAPPLESPPGTGGEVRLSPSAKAEGEAEVTPLMSPPAIAGGEGAVPPLESPPGIGGEVGVSPSAKAAGEAEVTPLMSPPAIAGGEMGNEPETNQGFPLFERYRRIGYAGIRTCALTGQGVDTLRQAIAGKTSMFIGASGVGKTSLLNRLSPDLGRKVAEISRATGKGIHTTSTTEIVPLDAGTFIADSPGVREFAMWGVTPLELGGCFREFRPFVEQCRFRDCLHDQEVGCAVKRAVQQGEVDRGRWESYLRILQTL